MKMSLEASENRDYGLTRSRRNNAAIRAVAEHGGAVVITDGYRHTQTIRRDPRTGKIILHETNESWDGITTTIDGPNAARGYLERFAGGLFGVVALPAQLVRAAFTGQVPTRYQQSAGKHPDLTMLVSGDAYRTLPSGDDSRHDQTC